MTLNLLFNLAIFVFAIAATVYACYLSATSVRSERVQVNDVRMRELEADVFSSDIEGVVAAAERRVEDELRSPRVRVSRTTTWTAPRGFVQGGYIRPDAITFENPAEAVRPTCNGCGGETLATLEGYRRRFCDACAGGLERKNRPSTTDG